MLYFVYFSTIQTFFLFFSIDVYRVESIIFKFTNNEILVLVDPNTVCQALRYFICIILTVTCWIYWYYPQRVHNEAGMKRLQFAQEYTLW